MTETMTDERQAYIYRRAQAHEDAGLGVMDALGVATREAARLKWVDDIELDHVPREVIFGYPVEPGECVDDDYVETCMCGETVPCST